jgi:hypothetical protein
MEIGMKLRFSAMLILVFLVVGFLFAQEPGYQAGKIVSVTKKDTPSAVHGSAPTNAPLASSTAVYDVVVETGGKTYNTVYKTQSDLDPTWKEGKDVDVQVQGKTLYLKVKGKPVKLMIVSSK